MFWKSPFFKGFNAALGRNDLPIPWQAAMYRPQDVSRFYTGAGMGNRVAAGVIAQTVPQTFLGKLVALVTGRKPLGEAGDVVYDWVV